MTLLYFFVSLMASVAGAISGIGGGMVIKPVLDATHTLSVGTISFLSGCTVLVMTTVSLIRSRKGSVTLNMKMSTLLGIGAALGGVLGKELFDMAQKVLPSESIVGAIQSIILLIITVGVLLYIRFKNKIISKNTKSPITAVIIGIVLGLISSFLGIGGGPLNIALLYYFFSMEAKNAALNSLYIIFLSQIASLISTLVHNNVPVFDPVVLIVMILGGVSGALIGGTFNKRMSNKHVEIFFSGLLVIIAFINIYNFLQFVL